MPQRMFIKGMYCGGLFVPVKKLNCLHSNKMDLFCSLKRGTVVESVS